MKKPAKKKQIYRFFDRKRLVILEISLFFLFCLLIIQFYQIQVIEGEKWEKDALAQHQTILTESFIRGSFYSNTSIKAGHPEKEQPLVMDILKFHLYIDPKSIPDPYKQEIARHFLNWIDLDESKLMKEFYKKSRSRKIASWLDKDLVDKILLWWKGFAKEKKIASNAVYIVKDYKRSYPFGSLLGQVLHTVQDQKDPLTMQSLPTGGLEMQFDKYLRGELGKKRILRSPTKPLDTVKVIKKPENGADIYLTINHNIQAIAEKELEKGLKKANAKGGWVVMMDPYSGEILALAQYPSFHPSKYREFYNKEELLEHTRVKAVTDCFEPGSIFKVITTAICTMANRELMQRGEEPLFHPEEMVPTRNGHFPGRPFPLKDGRQHAFLNLSLALQKSSNIYFATLIQRVINRMGNAWYREKILRFCFGQKTGLEIPGEASGLVPTPGKLHPNNTLEWSLSTPYSLAIGHNILVTSIQMLRAVSAIANGGKMVKPTLVKKIEKKSLNEVSVLYENQKKKESVDILAAEDAQTICNAMKFVTKLGGTSVRADISGYTKAGKSGSSEKIIRGKYSRNHYISSFVGFAPAKKPHFVMIVCVDDPEVKYIPGVGKNYLGGVCASPIFKEIGKQTLQYLGVEPDDPYGSNGAYNKKADMHNELKNIKDVYRKWNK